MRKYRRVVLFHCASESVLTGIEPSGMNCVIRWDEPKHERMYESTEETLSKSTKHNT